MAAPQNATVKPTTFEWPLSGRRVLPGNGEDGREAVVVTQGRKRAIYPQGATGDQMPPAFILSHKYSSFREPFYIVESVVNSPRERDITP